LECKYFAPLDEGQIIKYLELITHHFYHHNCEDVFLFLLTMDDCEPRIFSKYRDPQQIEKSIRRFRFVSDADELYENLAQNFGWLSWQSIMHIIEGIATANLHYSECEIIKDLKLYLRYKLH
jgi:hypothetical protein